MDQSGLPTRDFALLLSVLHTTARVTASKCKCIIWLLKLWIGCQSQTRWKSHTSVWPRRFIVNLSSADLTPFECWEMREGFKWAEIPPATDHGTSPHYTSQCCLAGSYSRFISRFSPNTDNCFFFMLHSIFITNHISSVVLEMTLIGSQEPILTF